MSLPLWCVPLTTLFAALTVAASLPMTAQLESRDAYPSWSPDGERIVFESTRDGNHEIYVMNRDGSEVRRLTHHEMPDRIPSFLPDGQNIVFQSARHSSAYAGSLTYQIYVMDADGGNVRRLTHNSANDTSARPSPDGRHILFTSDRDGIGQVHLMGSDGDHQTNITADQAIRSRIGSGAGRFNAHWSADGAAIYFDTLTPETDTWDVYRFALGGGELLNVSAAVEGSPDLGAFYPAASPDGKTVAVSFDHDPDGNTNWEIWIHDLETGASRRLTEWSGNDFWQEFSPDGRSLVFYSERDGEGAIYTIGVDGTGMRRLTGAAAGGPRR